MNERYKVMLTGAILGGIYTPIKSGHQAFDAAFIGNIFGGAIGGVVLFGVCHLIYRIFRPIQR